MGHEPVFAQDMRLMGGLRKFMPVTSTTFLIGCVAIAGIPPLAGFWSKDEILGQAFNSFPLLWVMGFITAGMTAFYMFRLYFSPSKGSSAARIRRSRPNCWRRSARVAATTTRLSPMATLPTTPMSPAGRWPCRWRRAGGALGADRPARHPWNSRFARLLDPHEAAEIAEHFSWGEFLPLAGASVAISTAGIGLAVAAYALRRIDLGQAVAARLGRQCLPGQQVVFDAINDNCSCGQPQAGPLGAGGGPKVVDGVVNLTGLMTLGAARASYS